MAEPIEWNFFDRNLHVDESIRNLPHLEQQGAVTFVTLRLADSMPKVIVAQWHIELQDWLEQNGLSGLSIEQVLNRTDVSQNLKQELQRFKNRAWHNRLDDCHGECIFRRLVVRSEVVDSVLHFNGQRYDIESFVVMPNHAHLLIQMRQDFGLRKSLREIQRFSARQINKLLERDGELWQGEPFDHIIRNETQFEYLKKYIFENPFKAKLRSDEFTYWKHR